MVKHCQLFPVNPSQPLHSYFSPQQDADHIFQFEEDSPREDILKWRQASLPPSIPREGHRGPPAPSLLVIDHHCHLDHLEHFDHPGNWSRFHGEVYSAEDMRRYKEGRLIMVKETREMSRILIFTTDDTGQTPHHHHHKAFVKGES